jgi:hypothetical protein
LMIKELRHLQHGLAQNLQTDDFLHNKLILACQNMPACQYACSSPQTAWLASSMICKRQLPRTKAHTNQHRPSSQTDAFTDNDHDCHLRLEK